MMCIVLFITGFVCGMALMRALHHNNMSKIYQGLQVDIKNSSSLEELKGISMQMTILDKVW